jgi:NAD kinase
MKRLLIIPSKSRYELEVERRGSEEAARAWFGKSEVWDYILSSYEAQKKGVAELKKAFSSGSSLFSAHFTDRSGLTEETIAQHDLFAFVGGDNHFTYCAQQILRYQQEHPSERKEVIGVSLDPSKSVGALLQCNVPGFIASYPRIQAEECSTTQWTTLEAIVMSSDTVTKPHPAVGDYFIGEKDRFEMSRSRAYIDGKPVLMEKSSGILVASGAGSGDSSWYDNGQYPITRASSPLRRDERKARILLTENKQAVMKGDDSVLCDLLPGQVLSIYSYNDDAGLIVPDSHREHGSSFMIGAHAEVRISDNYLYVIKLA